MNGNLLLAVVVLWPILASIIAYAIGKNINRIKDALVIFVTTTELALTLYMAFTAFGSSFSISICAINFELDGFSRNIRGCDSADVVYDLIILCGVYEILPKYG